MKSATSMAEERATERERLRHKVARLNAAKVYLKAFVKKLALPKNVRHGAPNLRTWNRAMRQLAAIERTIKLSKMPMSERQARSAALRQLP